MINERFGKLGIEGFLQHHWHKKPLFVAGAFNDVADELEFDEHDLAAFATDEAVESRLVREHHEGREWTVQNGPFDDETLEQLPAGGWSLLVQGLEQWVPSMAALLDEFRFLPNWRLDDIMASFAPPGGSVGPHYDQYDVFLIQVKGKRTWQLGELPADIGGKSRQPSAGDISAALSPWLRTDTDLKILKDFPFSDTFEANPGDLLYLPPGYAHFGVASEDAITLSVGFRSIDPAQLALYWSEEANEQLTGRLLSDPLRRGPGSVTTDDSGRIDSASLAEARKALLSALDDCPLLQHAFCRAASESRNSSALGEQAQANGLTADEWLAAALETGLSCRDGSRFVYSHEGDSLVFGVDGDTYDCEAGWLDHVKTLCHERFVELPVSEAERFDTASDLVHLMFKLYQHGSVCVHCDDVEDDPDDQD
ncbi:MAG: transcription factor [unclassified Hahellaceae]|nr:transcription factor [Hahellaceae bacterium]|tara:strand:+ start:81052 stop:82323 length:1272 start_codon:yes stop_codon:yes gene_type:complete